MTQDREPFVISGEMVETRLSHSCEGTELLVTLQNEVTLEGLPPPVGVLERVRITITIEPLGR